jgi:hypothetical protein
MQISRHHVVISNHWHKPAVKVQVHWDPEKAPAGGIQLELSLADLMEGVIQEMESRRLNVFLTKAQIRKALSQAIHDAVEKVKETSVHRPSLVTHGK